MNNVSKVAVNAFSGLGAGDGIFMWGNQLTVIEEEVWQPLLLDDVQLFLGGNPLFCGCDIAWIVLNPTFLNLIASDTTCATGELLVDLDPTFYEENC
ncbi:oplophorus-luciferin 2-monooxygenase non-catalytic subunit-like [Homarus americanus]|uniref:oplophorus-luciferin 2-monooxygenase non-catalytic subunit-like n=1 Tax=Homarus americanus TaxID=6706 RepID=UPI001C447C66|nr:oplophorus-luciferin 2-monooxygenase non-catalytic subunit-like [Homarus americanus]